MTPDGDSATETGSRSLAVIRYALPVAIAIAGVLVAVIGSTEVADALGAALIGAATVIVLLNLFMRLALQSNRDREREERARRYYDRYGRWPGPGDV